jgi:ABC-2 type transport system ATP-binding protein
VSAAIEAQDISRVFGSGKQAVVALDRVSFRVAEGEIVGLLGANGAGKTTLTKILSTLLLPTSGTARVLGVDVVRDPRRARRAQSVVLGGDRGLYGQLSALENLRFFGMLSGLSHRDLMARIDAALTDVGLAEVAQRKVFAFSRGMRQRLHIAIGMISRPRVLLLDEPTVGLDPAEAKRLRETIASLRDQGVSVLLTSHYLHDVEELADRVVMIERGRVTHEMTVGQFTATAGYAAILVVRGTGTGPGMAALGAAGGVGSQAELDRGGEDGWTLSLRLPAWSADVFTSLSTLLAGAKVTDIEVLPARLEDAFLRLQSGAGG